MSTREDYDHLRPYGHMDLFATNKTYDDLQNYIDRFSGSERAIAAVIFGMTVNTVLAVLDSHDLLKPIKEGGE